ncbi:SAGA complex subunit 1 [Hibiscus trionum]|uniref:SAGA complex subunit 1 n=1 Tax=Hibiscus trionum TaxID=183268 RepID=A0A9W7J9C7_HIBTR|nr:SAGA complex subunit 1 [Hibiscus trionum]
MLSSGNNLSRGNAGLPSDMPPLPQCLALDPITLGSQRYTRSGELSRVLGVPFRSSTSEDHTFGVSHSKLSPPVATEELKNFKESVQDASRKARDRVKKFRESISKLERYREALSTKKQQRSDISSERTSGVSIAKMGSQIRNTHEIMNQRSEDRPKGVGLNKRVRTSFADIRADNRTAVNPRQQGVVEKDGDVLPAVNGGSAQIEEKIRRLPGEGWETKMKRKRSVAAVGNRIANAGRDIKRAMQPKMSSESKLQSCDTMGFRSKSSPGVSGINRSHGSFEAAGSEANTVLRNELESTSIPRDRASMLEQRVVVKTNTKASLLEENQASGSSTMLKGKVSRAPRTGSIMVLDSSSKVHLSSGSLQGWEQPNPNKIQALGVVNNKKRPISTGSSSHAISQWGGQRPHKISRTRRANLVSPMANGEAQISSQGFATPNFGARVAIGTGGSLLGSSVDNFTPNIKREPENISSPFGLSESEESGAGDNKSKEKGIDTYEVNLPASQKAGAFLLPTRKNKNTNEIGDGVRRQGRNGSSAPPLTKPGVYPLREKLDNLTTTKLIQAVRPASDKNRSKTGRPPSKKLKDRKAATRVGLMLNNVSSDFTGESDDDDRDELFAAATSARNASGLACSGPFWKKMGSIFNSVSSEDTSYLRQQLSLAEGLDESLSQIFGDGFNVLDVAVQKDAPDSVEEVAKTNAASERLDIKKFYKVTPLYQRVLSALIEEDEGEEIYPRNEAKNMSLHYASDDSHCGSCSLMDVEFRDRDRMESEVESNTDFQCQKNSLFDRMSGDMSVASNTFRNCSMSNSLHSSERWLGDDDLSHMDTGPVSEICSTDMGQLQHKEINVSDSSSDCQYQLMCMDDKLLLELNSIGIYPESLPDLVEGEEAINQNVVELNECLYQQVQQKKKKLGEIDKAIEHGRDVEKRDIEHVAMDQLIEMAYRRCLACRRSNSSKSAVRKVSKQAALAFVKRTVERCRKFEQTGNSCFSEPALQDIMFSVPPCSNEAKSVDCIGSGTASNICNEISNHQAEARGSGAVSSTYERKDSSEALPAIQSSEHAVSMYGSMLNKGRKREVLIDDVVGSASSRITSTLDGSVGVNGREQSRENLRNTSSKEERKTKAKAKQKNSHLSCSGNGFNERLTEPLKPTRSSSRDKISENSTKETDEPMDFASMQLNELDTMEELGVPNEVGGPPDLSSWLNFDEDGLQDHDSIGLEIPMDDLSELKFAF